MLVARKITRSGSTWRPSHVDSGIVASALSNPIHGGVEAQDGARSVHRVRHDRGLLPHEVGLHWDREAERQIDVASLQARRLDPRDDFERDPRVGHAEPRKRGGEDLARELVDGRDPDDTAIGLAATSSDPLQPQNRVLDVGAARRSPMEVCATR
ncbi:hypothetical protein BH09MYX1_BH09MYX1_23740 [soil metagenome]